MDMRRIGHRSSIGPARGQIRLGILVTAGIVLVVSLLVYFWIRQGSSDAENIGYDFIKKSYMAEDFLDAVTEVELKFGDPNFAENLENGFSTENAAVEDAPTAWGTGLRSTFWIDITQVADKLAFLRCAPYVFEAMKQQSISIIINSQYLTDVDLDLDWREYSFNIPESYLQEGRNKIEFKYVQCAVPAEVFGETDTRELAVNFDYLQIKAPPTRKSALVQRWTLQDQAKNVLAVGPEEYINYYVEIPPGARLRFDFGVKPDALTKVKNVTYQIVVQPDTEAMPEEVLSRTLEGEAIQPSWIAEEVELLKYARQLVRIRFQVSTQSEGADPQPLVGWGNLRLTVEEKEKASADTGKGPSGPPPGGDYNILVIFLDGLRADHTSHLGYYRATTPNIDALARESIYFSQAISPANATLPAQCSIFTGLYPYMHGVRAPDNIAQAPAANWWNALKDKDSRYAATAFVGDAALELYYKRLGFKTHRAAASAAKPATEADDESETSESGSGSDTEPAKAAPATRAATPPSPNVRLDELTASLGAVSAWLQENAQERFFLVYQTNFLLPPFMPPAPFGEMFYPEYYVSRTRVLGSQVDEKLLEKIQREELETDSADIKHLQALYDGKVRYLDQQIGTLLQQLHDLGVGKNTIVILTSSQGLQLGEHGTVGTLGGTLYDEEIRVPLMIRFPDAFKFAPKPVNLQVRLIDIMPTILDTLGIPANPRISGVSLVPFLKGQTLDLTATSEAVAAPFMALRTNEWKLIGQVTGAWVERPLLLNHRIDPEESSKDIKRPVLAGYFSQDLSGRLALPDKIY